MIARRILGATTAFQPPEGWDEGRYGKCPTLHARVDGAVISTAWEPTPEELALLNAGGSVVLSVVGMQPTVALTVMPPAAEDLAA